MNESRLNNLVEGGKKGTQEYLEAHAKELKLVLGDDYDAYVGLQTKYYINDEALTEEEAAQINALQDKWIEHMREK
jgi:plasmid maintenance system antidote protein VapI